ncbi:hypothetical protein [Microbispora sp. H10670]|uniref:hypothetical protein n=1 Tax=Microbispora sp. H10670 TaxID=2729108 RepID=UPI0016033BC3|nr:hypothetical protein [Microbispora sp. H10670]
MSRTSRSIRGRCAALAAVTAGVSWLTWGTAMAKDGASSDACRPRNHDITGHDVTGRDATGHDSTDQGVTRHEIARREATDRNVRGVPATLAPAAGVLSIADAAGSAAGQGHRSLPGRPVPDPAVPGVAKPVLPALTASRALPGTSSARALTGLVPRTGNAPAAGAAPVRVPGAAGTGGGRAAGVPSAAGRAAGVPSAVGRAAGVPSAVGGATTPAAAGVPARSLPVGLATAPSAAKPISAGTSVLPSSTKPISLGTSGLPSATKPLAAGASALSSPARSLTAPAATVAGSRVPAAAPVANSGTLLPARSAVPLLAVAPARPSASDAACPPQAPQGLRGEPAEQERVRPLTEGRPRARRHPRPEEEAGNAGRQSRAAHNPAVRNPAAHNPVAHNPAGQNPAGQGSAARPAGQGSAARPAEQGSAARPAEQAGLTPQSSTVSTSSQSGASGQEQTTETFPRKHPHRRHHPHKQDGTPEQAANQAGRPASAAQEDTGTATERKNGAGHRRQRDDAAAPAQAGRPQAAGQDRTAQGKSAQGKAAQGKSAQGRKIAPAVQPETVGGRRVPRLQPREYPRAAAHPQGGDITTPAALTRATGTHGVTDFAAATGNRILP